MFGASSPPPHMSGIADCSKMWGHLKADSQLLLRPRANTHVFLSESALLLTDDGIMSTGFPVCMYTLELKEGNQ